MKRAGGLAILPAAVVLLLGTPRATAAELDIDLSSEVGAEHTRETDIFTETAADASLSWILSPDSDIEVAGGYSYRYDEGAPESDGEFTPALDRARYFTRVPISADGGGTVAELTAGRFGLRDTTGMVVDTPADGVSAGIVAPVVTFRVQSAYTGFLFRDSTDVRLTTGDLLDDDNLFGPAHLLGRVELAFPELLGRQSIIVDAVGHLDLPELTSSELDSTDEADGLYSSLTLTGPLSRRVFYTVYGIGRASRYFADSGDNDETYSTLAAAAGASLRAFAPQLGKSRAELQLGWAGGEDGFSRFSPTASGTARHFAPITAPSLVRFTPLLLSNIAFAKLDYSVQPVSIGAGPREGLRTAVSVAAVYRPVEGAGTVSGLPPTADVGYIGTEAGTTIEIRPVSDLRFALEGDIFWPSSLLRNAGTVDDTTPQSRVTARIELSL
ncbi:MAG: hypothetical protein GVY14_16225 [Spirochaetes bacterium]|jgi:hypothetical protein|nr:hypothetical protein [Spirochaetota bacterium]